MSYLSIFSVLHTVLQYGTHYEYTMYREALWAVRLPTKGSMLVIRCLQAVVSCGVYAECIGTCGVNWGLCREHRHAAGRPRALVRGASE